MPVSIKGSGGGSVTLDAGAAAADTTLTIPNTTGTVALTASPTFSNSLDVVGNTTGGVSGYVRNTNTTASSYSISACYSNNGTEYVQLISYAQSTGYLVFNQTGGGVIVTPNAQPIAFSTNNTERMRLDSSGNLLVGTANASPAAGTGLKFLPGGQAYSVLSTTTDTWDVYSTTASAYRFYVTNAGTIFATNTTISAISDVRFKENIRDLDVGLDAINALKPRNFDWKQGKGKDIKNDRGFIAQEIEQVFPDLIDTWKDPAPEGEEPYKTVRQDLIPILVKAIQELSAKNDALEARLAALEAK